MLFCYYINSIIADVWFQIDKSTGKYHTPRKIFIYSHKNSQYNITHTNTNNIIITITLYNMLLKQL